MRGLSLGAASFLAIGACGGGGGGAYFAPQPSPREEARIACMNDCNFVAASCPSQMGVACDDAVRACVAACDQMVAHLPDVAPDAGGPPPEQQAQPEPQPQRTALEHVIEVLAANGYQCTQEEFRYLCTVPASNWQVAVAWLVETDKISIWYDSYQLRAFARPCAEFTNAMNDLASSENAYLVSCDDKFQSFRMNTAILYGPDIDVMGWMNNHLQRRDESVRLLGSISAIRQ